MTPNLRIVYDYIKAKYGLSIGVTNCRKISGSQTYSQHSWSNAGDIYTTSHSLQDAIRNDLWDTFGSDVIRHTLTWRYNAAHWNHVHVDLWPKGWLTPPCVAGGVNKIKFRDGTVQIAPFPLTINEEVDMAILSDAEQIELQQFLQELEDIKSNVSFVRYLIPWFRKWRSFEPADFAAEGECECTLPATESVTILRDV